MTVLDYWRRSTGHVERVYEYHVAKIGHSLLIAALVAAAGAPFGLHPFTAVLVAIALYLVVGKWLVRSHPSPDWFADTVIGCFAIPAYLGLVGQFHLGLELLALLIGVYTIVVLWLRWASP